MVIPLIPTKPTISNPNNPYRDNTQGKANEPITVAGILDRAYREVGDDATPDWSLEAIYDRLEENAPRVAIIGGSPDHPAHIMDPGTTARAALQIWKNGGLPFVFSVPVLCDGTAQSNMGMSYSLQSRNAIAEMVVNQMEAHSYHAAFVIQSCDKMPMAVVSALAHLDRLRAFRGEAPVTAVFAPAHVLKGGVIPDDVRAELESVAADMRSAGQEELAEDLEEAMRYILQCSSNTAFQGVFLRAIDAGVLDPVRHKQLEKGLAVNTCDAKGGICAFNGTGNSSRHLVAALGLVHPSVELLTDPPTTPQVNAAVDSLFEIVQRPECGVGELVRQNMGNAVRMHSASGGSTNLLMHLVGAAIYAGVRFTIRDLDRIHHSHPVPDLFNYSLTEGRDIFALAKQCCSGDIRGMETLFYELVNNGVPMDLDAMTVTGSTWGERISDTSNLSATGVAENPVILATPRRPISGVDVLESNWFESAVVKISGMPERQVNQFDETVAFTLVFETEELANESLLDQRLLDHIRNDRLFAERDLMAVWNHNRAVLNLEELPRDVRGYELLFDHMVKTQTLKIAIVIAGQGPVAYGMPEMFTPMQHINANRTLRALATLISDGRYSGVSYGAAIGHVTPEAALGGKIIRMQTGDLLHLRFRLRRLDLLDPIAFELGDTSPSTRALDDRVALEAERIIRLQARQRRVAASNRMVACTDASAGVVPQVVWDDCQSDFWEEAKVAGINA